MISSVGGLLCMVACMGIPASAAAQGVRGWVGSTVQVVEMRPLALDTVLRSELTLDALGRPVFDGRLVTCALEDLCTLYALGPQRWTLAATQDVNLTAWGFGVEGLSVTTLLRARARAGDAFVWPRSDDRFDALLGYAQLVRGRVRARAGRQEIRSGLGFAAFDGASVFWTPGRWAIEAYGGWSLARGLREPGYDALKGLESYLTDQNVHVVGGSAGYRHSLTAATVRYQREIHADRASLVSERASLDVTSTLPGVRLSAALDYDFSFQRIGKSHLSATVPLGGGHWLVEATARRYVPYFQLSTIWGYFEPVAYTEAETRVGWSPSSDLGIWLGGGWRSYGDAGATVVLQPLRDDGWRGSAGVQWHPMTRLAVEGRYVLEWLPGGFLNSADAVARFRVREGLGVALSGTTFQQFEQFRLGEGRAFGGGLSTDAELTDRLSFTGGVTVLRHRTPDSTVESPWNQTRGWTSLRVGVGREPGLERGGTR
ncbi:MAG: hypothetical protein OEZ65_10850 [Gemmatimonadota bacterium]|nr:hypothetical protein [Gemmatimonadota bacterium]MDH5760076.1 hypothetical protein [Gemmatimonadota bacterium]